VAAAKAEAGEEKGWVVQDEVAAVAAAMAAAVWGWVAMAAVAGPLEPLQ